MTRLVTTLAALCLIAGPAIAQEAPTPASSASAQAIKAALDQGLVVPAASPLRLVSVTRGHEVNATFAGRVEISGTYEVELYGEEIYASLWPDPRSRQLLPHWDQREEADKLFISNPEEFAKAVVSAEELAKLKAGRLPLIRGQATIVADEYETGIECDASHFSARFVSLSKNIELAGDPGGEGGC